MACIIADTFRALALAPYASLPLIFTFYLAEFEADAKAKAEELGALLSEREEEFYSYQNSHSSADDDDYDDEEDDEDDDKPKKPKPPVDSIDYADDEEEEDGKDEM